MNVANVLGAHQIKAARALLDWSQEDLANYAALSVATIRKLELGHVSPRAATNGLIRKAFENGGIEFLDSEGVRRREDDLLRFRGADCSELFQDDILQTVHRSGGEVVVVADSLPALYAMFGGKDESVLEGLLAKDRSVAIKVLLTETIALPVSGLRLDYRSLSSSYVDAMPFCVYGDKYVMVTSGAHENTKLVVVQSVAVAQYSRRQFYSMWEKGMSFRAPSQDRFAEKRASCFA